jgi:CspA family cold shock protein
MGRQGDPSRTTSDLPATDATVKWFNSEKGFGFVALADESGDAFLHIATLEAAGFDALEPGTKLRVQAGQGPKGRQVTVVLEVSCGPPVPVNRMAMRNGSDIPDQPDSPTTEVHGTVKWFNPVKGFGFVGTGDGGKDIFVHISLLEKEGLRGIAEGQKVFMQVQQRQKGREAISIKVMP